MQYCTGANLSVRCYEYLLTTLRFDVIDKASLHRTILKLLFSKNQSYYTELDIHGSVHHDRIFY